MNKVLPFNKVSHREVMSELKTEIAKQGRIERKHADE